MKIKKATEKDFQGMMQIAKKLHPKWFDNIAINQYMPLDLRVNKGFVAEEKDRIVGFLTYASRKGRVDISWIGVNPKFQGKDIGSKLVETLEKTLKRFGVKELQVETVARSTKYKPYKKTREFYKKLGFKVKSIKEVKSKDTGRKFNLATLVKKI